MGKSIENILALADAAGAAGPIEAADSAEKALGGFFVLCAGAKGLARLQAADKKTHPFPAGALARQSEQLAAVLFRQTHRVNENVTVAHGIPAE